MFLMGDIGFEDGLFGNKGKIKRLEISGRILNTVGENVI
jgi:hypothetical protein